MTSGLSAFPSWHGVHATILGLGTFGGGLAAARFLADRGAKVTVTDQRSEADLADSLQQLSSVKLEDVLLNGHPPRAFANCELLVVNPAVSPAADVWAVALQNQPVQTTELGLFLHHCPARTVAVTGSNGKSTTTALIHHLLEGSNFPHANYLGGNIGSSLLPMVDQMTATDVAVLEISSFQLHYLREHNFAPDVAVITNFTPNHLDWHPSLPHYQNAKQLLLNRQTRAAVAVLPTDHEVNVRDPVDDVPAWRVRAECLRFGTSDTGEDGVFFEDGLLVFRRRHLEDAVRWPPSSNLPGTHNLANVAAAAAATWVLGGTPQKMADHIPRFQTLPHRLQSVAQHDRIRFINDSVATTPESGIAALKALNAPTVIIAGGADKGLNLEAFAAAIAEFASAAVLIGQTGPVLQQLIQQRAPRFATRLFTQPRDFDRAVRTAVELSPQGGIVLLSPGCASYGWFRDYRQRGEHFVRTVQNLSRNS